MVYGYGNGDGIEFIKDDWFEMVVQEMVGLEWTFLQENSPENIEMVLKI